MRNQKGTATMTVSPSKTTTTTWTIDPAHSSVEFKVKHMMISTVKGQFGAVEGTITIDEANLANSSVDAKIDTQSVTTHNEMRDNHLRTNDFFNAEEFRYITFKSTKIELEGDEEFKLYGDLTIRDVTKPIVLEAELDGFMDKDAFGKRRVAFSAETDINRKEFGVNWSGAIEGGGVVVGDKVKVELNIAATQN